MDAKLTGTRASSSVIHVITGAAGGIGAALARRMAARDSILHLVDVDEHGLERSARAARERGASVRAHAFDLSDSAAVQACGAALASACPHVDTLVNNAGVSMLGAFETLQPTDLEWVMNVNFWAPVRLTHMLLPRLRAAPRGHIVNVSSVFGLVAPAGQTAYASSKFALRGFSEALAHELENSSVCVTTVLPGGVKTGIAAAARRAPTVSQEAAIAVAREFASRARTTPEEAAEQIVRAVAECRARLLIGADARRVDRLQRLLPERHWSLLRRHLAPKALSAGTALPARAGQRR
jgi:short-subunit dehydrogenase